MTTATTHTVLITSAQGWTEYTDEQILSVIEAYNEGGNLENVLQENARRLRRVRSQEAQSDLVDFYASEILAEIQPGNWHVSLEEHHVKDIIWGLLMASI